MADIQLNNKSEMKENKSINEVIKLYKTNNLKKAKEEIDHLLEKDENSEFLNIKGIILRALKYRKTYKRTKASVMVLCHFV